MAIDIGVQFWSCHNGFGIEMHKAIVNFDYSEADALVQSGVITFNSIIEKVHRRKALCRLKY